MIEGDSDRKKERGTDLDVYCKVFVREIEKMKKGRNRKRDREVDEWRDP